MGFWVESGRGSSETLMMGIYEISVNTDSGFNGFERFMKFLEKLMVEDCWCLELDELVLLWSSITEPIISKQHLEN